jgi:DNA-binding NtrC family response regulator
VRAEDLLVVDDDHDLADCLAELLEEEGFKVRTARNGREGLRRIAERQPDLVLLDVEMPLLTGPEMSYEMFLRDAGQETIPIVLLSGVTNLHEVAEAVGTPYFLPKPCSFEAVERLLAKALAERRAPVRTPLLPA